MSRELTTVLNATIGFWYGVLALIFTIAVFSLLLSYYRTRVKTGMPWYLIAPFFLGALVFFVGCGLHHFHLAMMVNDRQMAVTMHGHIYVPVNDKTHALTEWLQFVGAPLAAVSAVEIVRRFRNTLRIEAT